MHSTSKDYIEYANECREWASSARSDQERNTFITMAKTWWEAAMKAAERENQEALEGDTS